ncbi:MAG: 30S ribosomal protein S12 methylthiotransferase RimO [bacterium]
MKSTSTPTFSLISLGCPKNLVDSEVVIGLLEKSGYRFTPEFKKANLLLVNTCAFIKPAKEEAIRTILELAQYKKKDKTKRLFVLGCLPQRYQQEIITAIPEVDGWIGAGEFYQITNLLKQQDGIQPVVAIAQPTFIYHHTLPRHLATLPHTAYIKIAEGCNHSCSFCTVPRIRGRFRSRPMESIVAEVNALTKKGIKEINLIAQDITEYGIDLYHGYALVMLLKKLVQIPKLTWLRLLYAYPTNFSDELIDLIARDNKICNYIDLPIQHIDDTILASMNRKISSKQIKDLLSKIRTRIPNATIRTSLIAGYPGETKAQFQTLLDFVKESQFDRLGVFPYSREEHTTAYYLRPQISEKVKQDRVARIMQMQQSIVRRKNQLLFGKEFPILIDAELKNKRQVFVGRTQAHAPDIDGVVYVGNKSRRKLAPGQIISGKIVAAQDYDLIAEV